jgi:hypothetical protein
MGKRCTPQEHVQSSYLPLALSLFVELMLRQAQTWQGRHLMTNT